MEHGISPELHYLALTAGFTALIFLPVVLNRIVEQGFGKTLGTPDMDHPAKAAWAARTMHAHRNALENLAVFAPLVLAVQIAGLNSATTALWAMVFFWSRIVHAVTYALGIPVVRSLAFGAGLIAELIFAGRLLGFA